jgi:hypothetical protein
MSRIFLVVFLFTCSTTFGQSKGFEFLSSSKSSLESIIKVYATTIPDTSETYKKYYLPLARNYNKAKSSFDGYRGSMKDCIMNNNTKRKIQQCLQEKVANIKEQLDSLGYILDMAYLEAYSKRIIKERDPQYSGKNTGIITADFIKTLLDSLLVGTLKVWDQIKKYRKEYKDTYLGEISNKQYELSDIDELLIQKNKPVSAK